MTARQRNKAFDRINTLIYRHGAKMSKRQMDRALKVWDALAKAVCDRIPENYSTKRGTRFMKSADDHNPVVRSVEGGSPRLYRQPTFTRQLSPYTDSRTGAPLTGHQLVAQKAGLDINTPGLENMTFDQMKDLARRQLKQFVVPLQRAAGLHYNVD